MESGPGCPADADATRGSYCNCSCQILQGVLRENHLDQVNQRPNSVLIRAEQKYASVRSRHMDASVGKTLVTGDQKPPFRLYGGP